MDPLSGNFYVQKPDLNSKDGVVLISTIPLYSPLHIMELPSRMSRRDFFAECKMNGHNLTMAPVHFRVTMIERVEQMQKVFEVSEQEHFRLNMDSTVSTSTIFY